MIMSDLTFDLARPDLDQRFTGADFVRLSQLFYERTGVSFGANKRYFVDKRVLACMAEYGTDSFATYFSALRLGLEVGVFQRLVNALSVNETYFLREDYQYESLLRHVLPAVTSQGPAGRPVRILSLPCSTGDESYSIALTLLENWRDIDEHDVEIVGADIDTDALEAAQRGLYGPRAVQRLPRSVLENYFTETPEGRFQLDASLLDAVRFMQVNLTEAASVQRLRSFDVIFCRNLLIYFDELSSRIAAQNLFDMLRPGGFLFLGHAESMSRISNIFIPRRFDAGVIYQKPL